ncbi:MAG: L-serine ammonia-lyase [Cyclobacteriaceae bacterium]
MTPISVFDILKIGVGPSSSHTLGPWIAARKFDAELRQIGLEEISTIHIVLYGSLALTGKGHGTDIAVVMGLVGTDPETVPLEKIESVPAQVKTTNTLLLDGDKEVVFHFDKDIVFRRDERLPYHANGMRFVAKNESGEELVNSIYFSVGGGFVVHEKEIKDEVSLDDIEQKFPCSNAEELLSHCKNQSISQVVLENEFSWRNQSEINGRARQLWDVMKQSVYNGCNKEGKLPGGLNVTRRAAPLSQKLLRDQGDQGEQDVDLWIKSIQEMEFDFSEIIKWIGCFSMAVNEENASFGRIVTAPTNGSAGVIPAVLFYLVCFAKRDVSEEDIFRFLLTAGQIGILFKIGSTLSAAMGGCQAEIGVSSAMAAGALTEALGGSPQQALMAAEVAMEHHLGLTCDPIGGLVQIPCIERNSMGAVKAVTAATIALASDPSEAKVSLDNVIKSMWETAKDMNTNYKETSLGGLAVNVSVKISEC